MPELSSFLDTIGQFFGSMGHQAQYMFLYILRILVPVLALVVIVKCYRSVKLGRRPAYLYFFDRKLPGDQAGAFHSSELWYEFETLSRGWRPWEEHDWELAEQLSAYWANFVKNGDPNGPGLPPWHPYAGEHKEALVLR